MAKMFSATLLSVSILISLVGYVPTNAISGSDFNPSKIIDDGVFFNSNSMSVDEIQAFLNSKVTFCDTNHIGFTGGTGTIYTGPWICLKDFYENPNATYTISFSYKNTDGADAIGSRTFYENNAYKYTSLTPIYINGDYSQGYSLKANIDVVAGNRPSGSISAAQIIYNASQNYKINPQLLIITLQKEQGLITDSWPAPWQYQSAMGYGCPDTSPCSSGYAGFSRQVERAAWQFRNYTNNPNNFNFKGAANRYIQYNPAASCGGANVFIQNQATANLYNYTPYQPNAAALSNMSDSSPGGTASCGSYGNRNFFWYFSKWFGSTYDSNSLNLMNSLGESIKTGTTILPGDYISSPNGKFSMALKYDGSLVIYRGSVVIWSTRTTESNYGARVILQGDGNLVMYSTNDTAVWNSSTDGTGVNLLRLSDMGILELSIDSKVKWRSTSAPTIIASSISNGSILQPGGELRSPDGLFWLVMQSDGNLVMYSNNGPALWSSGTNNNAGAYLALQGDGNLVVYNANNRPLWSSSTAGKGSSVLYLQSDGNLVLYNNQGSTWSSGTDINGYRYMSYKGNSIGSGLLIQKGEYLRSNDSRYRLFMQYDGNLVIESVNGNKVLWSSGTNNNAGAYLALQGDGNLVVYNANNRPLWSSSTAGKGSSVLYLQSDGNLVLYNNQGSTWSSGTNGKF